MIVFNGSDVSGLSMGKQLEAAVAAAEAGLVEAKIQVAYRRGALDCHDAWLVYRECLVAQAAAATEQASAASMPRPDPEVNVPPMAPRAAKAKSRRKRPSRTSATKKPKATRADQVLELLSRGGKLTAAQMAKTLGIQPNYLYRVLPQLQTAGKVDKQGRYYLLPQTAPATD